VVHGMPDFLAFISRLLLAPRRFGTFLQRIFLWFERSDLEFSRDPSPFFIILLIFAPGLD